jgi:hypothetical protein
MQDNAWADERVMLEWHKVFQTDRASLGQVDLLLGLDNHGAQETVEFRRRLRQSHTQASRHIPSGLGAPYACKFFVFQSHVLLSCSRLY